MRQDNTFQVCWWLTKEANRFGSEECHWFLGDKNAVFSLYYYLSKDWPHIEIYDMSGQLQDPHNIIGKRF